MERQYPVKEETSPSDNEAELHVFLGKNESPMSTSTPTSPKSSHNSSPSLSLSTPIDPVKTGLIKGEVSIKLERGDSQPKLSRSATQRITKRTPMLFVDYEDKTEEAKKSFGVMKSCYL